MPETKRIRVYLFVGLVILGLLRVSLVQPVKLEINSRVRLNGRINSLPQTNEKTVRFYLDKYEIVFTQSIEMPGYNDLIEVTGVVKPKFNNPKYGIVIEGQTIKLKNDVTGGLRKQILGIRDFGISSIRSNLPSPESELTAGILLGAKFQTDTAFKQVLRKAGVSHVVVASGSNVAVIGSLVIGICTYLVSRRLAILIAIGGIWLFALMCNLDAPVVRGATMNSVALICLLTGRIASALPVLMATGLGMVIIEPSILGDVGFQLSFMATLGLVVVSRWGKNSLMPKFPTGLRGTLAAQIFTLPVVLLNFGWGAISWFAPITNLIILPLVSPIMFFGAGLIVLEIVERLTWGVSSFLTTFWAAVSYIPVFVFTHVVYVFGS